MRCTAPGTSPWCRNFIEHQINEFQFKHQDVVVELITTNIQSTAEAEHIVRMIQTQQYDRTIVRFNSMIYALVAKQLNDPDWHKTYLVDFQQDAEFVKAHKAEAIKNILSQKKYKDLLPGPILEGRLNCIWFNQGLGNQIGITLSGPEFSARELIQAAKKLEQYNLNHDTNLQSSVKKPVLGSATRKLNAPSHAN